MTDGDTRTGEVGRDVVGAFDSGAGTDPRVRPDVTVIGVSAR